MDDHPPPPPSTPDTHDPKVYEDDDESEVVDSDSITTEELFYPYIPRIKMIVDIPPWFAAYALTLLAYTFSMVAVSSRCH